jgi:copper chaperone CopZ
LTLPRDIGLPLLLGVLIAGTLSALVPPDSLAAYLGSGVLSILLLMVAGVPLYVCATASVPIAAGFIHMGASPGAALAFLIAGPATNAATVTTVLKVMGSRTAAVYLTTVALSAFGSGILLNWLAPVAQSAIPELSVSVHTHLETNLLFHLVAIVLLVLLVYSYLSERWQGRTSLAPAGEGARDVPLDRQLDLTVSGMNCSHCRDSVKRALSRCGGVQNVEVSLAEGRAMVVGRDLSPETLVAAVTSLGFEARLRKPIAPDA